MLRLGLGLTALALSAPAAHAANVISVGSGGGADHTRIQDALDAAAEGDVVVVLDQGTYRECLNITKDLSIVGSRFGGGSVTVQCGTRGSRAVQIDRADVSLSGLDLRHVDGGGVSIAGGSVAMADVSFEGLNTGSADGAGITASSSTVRLSNVRFSDTQTTGNGGAINMSGGRLEIMGATIADAKGRRGGAIFVSNADLEAAHLEIDRAQASTEGGAIARFGTTGTVRVRDSIILNSVAAGSGGAIWLGGSGSATHVIAQSTLKDNKTTSLDSGGGALYTAVNTSVVQTGFDNNQAEQGPGGNIQAAGGNFSMTGGAVKNGLADRDGGGLHVSTPSVLTDVEVSGNLSDGDGGGIYLESGSLTQVGGLVSGNEAAGSGGGLYDAVDRAATRGALYEGNLAGLNGGGVYIRGGTGLYVSHYGLVLRANEATKGGGGLYLGTGSRGYYYGLHASENVADVGGGVHIFGRSTGGVYFYESELVDNTARLGGGLGVVEASLNTGSIYPVYLQRSRVGKNRATDGAGIYLSFGALAVYDSWIHENAATGNGGGFFDGQGVYLYGRTAMVCGNSARHGGGAYLDQPYSTRQFYGGTFVENSASGDGGAIWSSQYSATSGASSSSYVYYNTFVGNSSGGLSSGVHVVVNSLRPDNMYVQYSIFESNKDTGLSQSSSSVTQAVPFFNIFSGHARSDIYNNPSYFIGDGYNDGVAAKFSSYTTGDCFDDDLRSSSGYSYGAQAVTGAFGYYPYTDSDGDGFTIGEGDCDEGNRNRYPGNTEVIDNGVDEDCSAWDDVDGDNDGYVVLSEGGSDCDDSNAAIHPDATDVAYDGINSDCGALSDNDADGDGHDAVAAGGEDCDDNDPHVFPGVPEVAFDGIDQDCDGLDMDLDGDGYMGVWTNSLGTALSDPAGLGLEVDCEPAIESAFPGGIEAWYDGIDGDCDGASDYDQDGDGADSDTFGGTDCDDTDPTAYLGAPEIWYDGQDQDCLGGNDFDQDGDGDPSDRYGGEDCKDDDPEVYDGAPEIKDRKDNDCNLLVDTDSDQDGVLDYYEDLLGTNKNKRDTDGDTIPDGVEWALEIETHEQQLAPFNTDGEGPIDALDLDADGDGIEDREEVGPNPNNPRDTDGDGLADFRDTDDDGDGIPTAVECPGGQVDTDRDGDADCFDLDSDGDGALDAAEGVLDRDGDGLVDYLDGGADSEGRPEPTVPDSYGFGLGCSSTGTAPVGLLWLLLPLVLRRRQRA